jgi:hypothetical protein
LGSESPESSLKYILEAHRCRIRTLGLVCEHTLDDIVMMDFKLSMIV